VVRFDRASLRKGDLVVHAEHGIGLYAGRCDTVRARRKFRTGGEISRF
jgi:transcription-repair coupling factor (superfamily II helicase)